MGLWRRTALAAVLALFAAAMAPSASAEPPPGVPLAAPTQTVSVQQLPPATNQPHFDADKATAAYLAQVSGAKRARSDAYFEGGYWLILVDALYALAVMGLLLWLKISAALRNLAQGITRSRFWQVPIYVAGFVAITTVATFPLTLYENFFREHAYGLSNQTFLQWFGDFATGFGVNLVMMLVLVTLIYSVVRVARYSWWLWGAGVTIVFLAFIMLIAPVFIAPLFNHYQPLPASPLKTQILNLASANGIPVNDVYEYDASRQSNRITANVSGFLGTTRISLADNLLKRCNDREILAVVGHEMGHYVLGHVYIGLTWYGLVIVLGFAFVNWGFRVLTGIFGGNWDVRTIDDPAGLPVVVALFTVFMFFMTPVTNTISRTIEAQADIFGLNAARQPDGFATVTLKLSEYRKLEPGKWEEIIFYDHPSGRARIAMAMHWKAAHLSDPDIAMGPVSPQ